MKIRGRITHWIPPILYRIPILTPLVRTKMTRKRLTSLCNRLGHSSSFAIKPHHHRTKVTAANMPQPLPGRVFIRYLEVKAPHSNGERWFVTVSEWYKEIGEAIFEGDVFVSVLCAGKQMQIRSTRSGFLVNKRIAEGQSVFSGEVIAVISEAVFENIAAKGRSGIVTDPAPSSGSPHPHSEDSELRGRAVDRTPFVDNPHAIEIFTEGAVDFWFFEGNVHVTLAAPKANYGVNPPEMRQVVVGRLVMSLHGAHRFVQRLQAFLDPGRSEPDTPPTGQTIH